MRLTKRETVQRALIALPIILGLVTILPTINNNLFSDLHIVAAKRDIETWRSGDTLKYTMKQWRKVQEHLKNGLKLDPTNPNIMFMLGKRHVRLQKHKKISKWKMRFHNRKAEKYFRQSIVARPTYPISWIYIAVIKKNLKVIGNQFWYAIDQSIRLGPWERLVTKTIPELGMIYYHIIPKSMHSQMVEHIHHGFLKHRRYLRRRLEKRTKIRRACNLLPPKKSRKKYWRKIFMIEEPLTDTTGLLFTKKMKKIKVETATDLKAICQLPTFYLKLKKPRKRY
jgi:hypothetical protein